MLTIQFSKGKQSKFKPKNPHKRGTSPHKTQLQGEIELLRWQRINQS